MRILSVSNCPLGESFGSGYVISGYARELRRRGHEVVTIGPEDYEWAPWVRGGKRARVFAGYSATALRRVDVGAFDVVELWGAEAWWAMRRLAARARRPLLVARSNGLETHLATALARHQGEAKTESWRRRIAGWAFENWQKPELAFRRADWLTTVSEFDRSFALERGYQPPERVLALENPLPDDWIGQPEPAERPKVIGFVGSWIARKGAELLPDVLAAVLRANPEWRARLVGAGEPAREAMARVGMSERVEIVPFETDRTRLRALYEGMAVVVMPSQFESFGLVAAEALACGCALVASPTGFAAGLGAEDARVVGEYSVAAWVEAILGLLSDPARRRQMAGAGQRRVQMLRWSGAVERLETTYRAAIAKRGSRT